MYFGARDYADFSWVETTRKTRFTGEHHGL